jgi:hypothetical protein
MVDLFFHSARHSSIAECRTNLTAQIAAVPHVGGWNPTQGNALMKLIGYNRVEAI